MGDGEPVSDHRIQPDLTGVALRDRVRRDEPERALRLQERVIAIVSKSVMPMRVPTGQVFSNKLDVFATSSYSDQAVLSSSLHQLWAIRFGATMRADPAYTPSTVFEPFPRPQENTDLRNAGHILDIERKEIMARRELGLTQLYNLVNDPSISDADDDDIARMRALHVRLDKIVAAAYGWADVSLGHGFHSYRQVTRWTLSPGARNELLDRLLEENKRRASRDSHELKG